jgi:predicted histidine transporter YuiF (NhaC family)
MSTSTSDNGLFNGQFDARIFVAIFVPAIFLLIIILTMLVFLIYRQPSYYDSYIINNENENFDNEKSDSKFEVLSRTPISYA